MIVTDLPDVLDAPCGGVHEDELALLILLHQSPPQVRFALRILRAGHLHSDELNSNSFPHEHEIMHKKF